MKIDKEKLSAKATKLAGNVQNISTNLTEKTKESITKMKLL